MPSFFSSEIVRDKRNQYEPEFYYCTIQDLRDIGIPAPPEENGVSDLRLQRLIVLVSSLINTCTNQFFQPWPKEEVTDGRGSHVLYTFALDKIIEVYSVRSVSPCAQSCMLSDCLYVLKERFVAKATEQNSRNSLSSLIRYVPGGFEFSRGSNNWVIDGIFGDIKILKKKETILLSSIECGDVELTVEETKGFKPGDYLLIDDQAFIINLIKDPSTICIDPSLVDIEVVPGKPIIRHGRVHDEIRDAAIRLVVDRLIGPFALTNVDDGSVRGVNDWFCDNVIMEKTDNYQYKLSNRTTLDRAEDSFKNGGTGNTLVDSILLKYLAPPYAAFV